MKRGILLIALAAVTAFADDVYLRGGGQITGEIVTRSEDSVTVDIGGGATITARMSSIVSIEEGISPLQEYRDRAGNISAGDAEAWRELAQWATGQMLASQASKAYHEVIAILPDDEGANRALGRVRLGGKWVTEQESYLARGYVEFDGEWMTPAERKTILVNRRGREEAARQANLAAIEEIEAEQEAERERDAAERREVRNDNLPGLGDPVFWGWGGGPTSWPQPSGEW